MSMVITLPYVLIWRNDKPGVESRESKELAPQLPHKALIIVDRQSGL